MCLLMLLRKCIASRLRMDSKESENTQYGIYFHLHLHSGYLLMSSIHIGQ